MTFKWESPNRNKTSRTSFREAADKLAAKPGNWARIFEVPAEQAQKAYTLSTAINRGIRAGFDKGMFEAVTRTNDGKTAVYARAKK